MSGYLTSSALSPAHYAFVQRVENAVSSSELEHVCQAEIDRLRAKLGKGGASDAFVREALVSLMHVATVRGSVGPDETGGTDFAVVHALNLAEGGKKLQYRALGYLYLRLHLSPSDERCLLLFNTILKDLQSSKVPSMVLALQAIISLPSRDIAPAVQAHLVHLVSHKSPEIKRLSLAALRALSSSYPDILIGLRERKIWKRLDDEDPGVALQAVRALSDMVADQLISPSDAYHPLVRLFRSKLGSTEPAVAPPRSKPDFIVKEESPTLLALLGVLFSMAASFDTSQKAEVRNVVHRVLKLAGASDTGNAIALECYRLLPALAPTLGDSADTFVPSMTAEAGDILEPLRRVLRADTPDGRVFALRSLLLLDVSAWSEGLGEESMGLVMAGLDSRDPGIRKLTILVLQKLSVDLPRLQLDRIMSYLPSASTTDREHAVIRGLEVFEVLVDQTEEGEEAAQLLTSLFGAAELLAAKGKDREHGEAWDGPIVLERAVARVLEWLSSRTATFRTSLSAALLEATTTSLPASPTLALLIAASACEALGPPEPITAAITLTRVLEGVSLASVQEALIVSLAGVLARTDSGKAPESVLASVRQLGKRSRTHIRKRCEMLERVSNSPEGFRAVLKEGSTLSSILLALEALDRSLAPPLNRSRHHHHSGSTSCSRSSIQTVDDSTSFSSPGPRGDVELKYDAYPAAPQPPRRPLGQSKAASAWMEGSNGGSKSWLATGDRTATAAAEAMAGELSLLVLGEGEDDDGERGREGGSKRPDLSPKNAADQSISSPFISPP